MPDLRQFFDLEESRWLRVELIRAGATTSEGHVCGVSADRIRVRFLQSSAPKLPLGRAVTVRFRFPGDITTDARVLARRDDAHRSVYVLQVLQPERIFPFLLPQIQGMYNRRGAVRIRPRSRVPVHARLSAMIGVEVRAAVFDLSASGISVRVSPVEEERLASFTEVDVAATFPAVPPLSISMRAAIRERRVAGNSVHLGLAFLPEVSQNFSAQEQAILQYVFAACAESQGKRAPAPCSFHPES